MSSDEIRQAILDGLRKEKPLTSLFGTDKVDRQADDIMDELEPVLDARMYHSTAFMKRQTFAVLWERANNDSPYKKWDIWDWLETEAFPLLYGEGHCFRCHGFDPAERPACEHESCPAWPACPKDDKED